jgi:hypothetical protein
VPAATCFEDIFASSKTDAWRHIGAFASELGLPEPSDAVFEAAAKDGKIAVTPAQLSMLLEGIDWRMPNRTWRPLSVG